MIHYVITVRAGESGARLSKSHEWGNVPYLSPAKAREAARLDAGDKPFHIEQRTIRPASKGG